ncbi:glycosyltransferase 87 family protein [Kineococcus indalonis]|uniref:glycosyltransferase 87 family protein n=1 Tax=Kineococcus indalonis TaxID=2696566 RepID=UPI001413123F|nr:glycosyltransferase 87 family protein [Kineococcus indalonis]NAZ84604.1 DUF2029 domain-containing protein [Kineococcus indalonis]
MADPISEHPRRPGAAGAVPWLEPLLRRRYAVVAALLAVSITARLLSDGLPGDWHYFREAARVLTSSEALGFYPDHFATKVGPLPLLLVAPLALLPEVPGTIAVLTLSAACLLVCLRVLEGAARAAGLPGDRRATTLVGGALAVVAWQELSITYVHPEDVLIAVLGCLALRAVLEGRPWTTAVLVGLAAGGKPWAVGLLPLALCAAAGRRRWVALGLAGAVTAAPWLPFLVAAPETLHAIAASTNTVFTDTPLGQLGYGGELFPAFARPVQYAVVVLVGVLLALRGQWRLLPLGCVAARLATDPQSLGYYWATFAVAALAADLLSRRSLPRWTVLVVLVTLELDGVVNDDTLGAVLQAAPLVVLVASVLLPRPRWSAGADLRVRGLQHRRVRPFQA